MFELFRMNYTTSSCLWLIVVSLSLVLLHTEHPEKDSGFLCLGSHKTDEILKHVFAFLRGLLRGLDDRSPSCHSKSSRTLTMSPLSQNRTSIGPMCCGCSRLHCHDCISSLPKTLLERHYVCASTTKMAHRVCSCALLKL